MRIIHPSEIKSRRLKAKLTQTELAEAAGISQAYIAKIESGKADPKFSTLEKISEALQRALAEEKIVAGEIMEKPIISVSPDDMIKKAIELMESYDISQIPIIKNKKQVGSLAEEMIIRKVSAGENMLKLVNQKAESIMGDPFPIVGTEADLDTIFPLLEHTPAILVYERGNPEGIITKADLLQLSTRYYPKSDAEKSENKE